MFTLTFKDTLVLGGGTNDLGRYKHRPVFKLATEFIKSNNHTNSVLLSIPHCHDLQSFSYTNKK
jgi:hypothetical protein